MKEIILQNSMPPLMDPNLGGSRKTNAQSNEFGQMLAKSIDDVNRFQLEADESINELADGRQTDIHQTMIAVEKADISLELLLQIRNKVVAAYERIMRMAV
jgi:flagellar hook-basal body complex protein FliE